MVTVVKIDNCLYRLNSLDLICVHIHPVNRTAIKIIKSRICGNELNCRCVYTGSYLNKSDYNRLITHIITDLKLNAMNTISNCKVTNSHFTVCKGYRNLNTVNISLSACSVQAGCVSLSCILFNCSRERDNVTCGCYYLILFKSSILFDFKKFHISKNRRLSIFYCIRKVSGNVININSLQTVYSTVCFPQIISICVGEHKLDETEVVCIVFRCIISYLILAIKTGNKNLAICTYVNREILPTGLIPLVINLRLIDNTNGILLIIYSIIIGLVPIKNTNPAMLVFIRNISPETNRLGIFNNYTIVKEQITLSISTIRNTGGCNRIHFNSHRANTIMNLAVLSSSIRKMLIEALVVTVYVSYIPSINIRSILKIKENLRALTKVERCGGNQVSVMNKSCGKSALQVSGSIFFFNRSKFQTIKYTKCIVSCSKYNILCFENYIIKATINSCINSNFNFLIKRNCHNSLCKRKFSRNYDFNGMFANNLATIYHLSCYLSKLTIGYKYTVLNGTH